MLPILILCRWTVVELIVNMYCLTMISYDQNLFDPDCYLFCRSYFSTVVLIFYYMSYKFLPNFTKSIFFINNLLTLPNKYPVVLVGNAFSLVTTTTSATTWKRERENWKIWTVIDTGWEIYWHSIRSIERENLFKINGNE